MDEVRMGVATLAKYKGMKLEELAEAADIEPAHLMNVSYGRAKMTARDLMQLSKATGIPPDHIDFG